jgi:hypothetical protein
MTAYLITRDEILDAIERVNALDTYSPVERHAVVDGTYSIIPTWIGNARVWMAQKIDTREGYEVAFEAILGDGTYDLTFARFGVWTDPETGKVWLDRTVHVKGSEAVAENIARHYDQLAIWDWFNQRAISIDD